MRRMNKEAAAADATGHGAAALAERETAAVVQDGLEHALERARDALLRLQDPSGYWCFHLEADCTIPAEYILWTHFMDEREPALESRLANYIRDHQASHGGWPLYLGGDFDLSCSVKAYYALKLAGDNPDAPHMTRAREAILAHGGAARSNVFTRFVLAQFGQVPWRAVPFMPVEIMLLPRWFPFHLSKVSYWSRTVMVPLLILYTHRVRACNPCDVNIRELFIRPPEEERDYFPVRSRLNKVFLALEGMGKRLEFAIPKALRRRALRYAHDWMVERLNGVHGLGAIFPAMVNAHEALATLGYEADHPLRRQAKEAIQRLVVDHGDTAWCQPCVSPVWDTALACLSLQEEARGESPEAVTKALDWLCDGQLLEASGDWQLTHPDLPGGGWPFQFANDHYPDLDDTAAVMWTLDRAAQPERYATAVDRAARWIAGMQSHNGGFAAFDSDNDHYYLNEIPFADHGALLDPPTADVSARCLAALGRLHSAQYDDTLEHCLAYIEQVQETDGSWFGRWGANYIYGTWSVLTALEQAGVDPARPCVARAVQWLKAKQRPDGGWGEVNDSYEEPGLAGWANYSTAFHTAWALLALMAAGQVHSDSVRRGIEYLLHRQEPDGLWHDPWFTAPGFPRVFYLKYHGYDKYFPLWALARYRNLLEGISR